MSDEKTSKVGFWQVVWVIGLLVIMSYAILYISNCLNYVNGKCEEARSVFLYEINFMLLLIGGAIFVVGLVMNYLVTAGKTPSQT